MLRRIRFPALVASAILLLSVYGCGGSGGGSPALQMPGDGGTTMMPGDGGQMPGGGDTTMMPGDGGQMPGGGDTTMMPVQTESVPLPADYSFVGSTSFRIEPGQSIDRGFLRFLCEGTSLCQVELDVANNVARFTGGTLTATEVPLFSVEPNLSLGPGERRLIQQPGSNNIYVIGCGHITERCVVMNFRWDDGTRGWRWTTSKDNKYFFGAPSKSGFFMEGEETVTLPNGRSLTLACPSGCAVARVWLDEQGRPKVERVTAYDENGNEISPWQDPVVVAQDGVRINPPVALDPNTGGQPQTPTPPAMTSQYAGLPDGMPKFPIDHWELSDGREYTPVHDDNRFVGFGEVFREVVCPGLRSNGKECSVQRREGNRPVYTVEDILSELDSGFTLYTPLPFHHGAVVSSNLNNNGLDINLFAHWGDHSAFGYYSIYPPSSDQNSRGYSTHHAFAWGHLYYGFPSPQGTERDTATWEGPAVGASFNWDHDNNRIHPGGNAGEGLVSGPSRVTYDFVAGNVDVVIDFSVDDRIGELKWDNIRQNYDGSFFVQGNHLENTPMNLTGQGYIDGDFYGPNAEEVAGVFQRVVGSIYVDGAFGGKRQ